MNRIALSMVAGLGLLALVPTAAMAHTDVSIGLNLGGGYTPSLLEERRLSCQTIQLAAYLAELQGAALI